MAKRITVKFGEITWFSDSPDSGHPDCTCSKCGLVILDLDDDEIPVRVFDTVYNLEARFHVACFHELQNSNPNPRGNCSQGYPLDV